MILADARTSDPTATGNRLWRGLSGILLSRFDRILTGGSTMADRYLCLGVDPETVEVKGFLEEGTPAMPHNEGDRNAIAQGLGACPVWLAMSVTDNEKDAVISAHRQARRRAHRLLLILTRLDEQGIV